MPQQNRMPDPTRKIAPDIAALVQSLTMHRVKWLLAGSYALTLHGADIKPNDLDAVVHRAPTNLKRLGQCLGSLDAVPFWTGDPAWDLGTPQEHKSWRPEPATIAQLDHLFVTRHGMLDIPFALVPDYDDLIMGCSSFEVAGQLIDVCDPRSVLIALESRHRKKDRERRAVYTKMRLRLGLPPMQNDE